MRLTVVTMLIAGIITAGATLPAAQASAAPLHQATAKTSTARVAKVIDGDTVRLANGVRVRMIGIDTPESGQCGSAAATAKLRSLVEGKQVTLVNPFSVRDWDRYGRALRSITVAGNDAGKALLRSGYANARYDAVDGYQWHPLQKTYRYLDKQVKHRCGVTVDRKGEPWTTSTSGTSSTSTSIPSGWYTDATYPGYTGCRQGYPGGKINGVYVWKPIAC